MVSRTALPITIRGSGDCDAGLRLDGLPQVFNVLVGAMSSIGVHSRYWRSINRPIALAAHRLLQQTILIACWTFSAFVRLIALCDRCAFPTETIPRLQSPRARPFLVIFQIDPRPTMVSGQSNKKLIVDHRVLGGVS